jgi:hypothetical protein
MRFIEQPHPSGTGDAVSRALDGLDVDEVAVLFGDNLFKSPFTDAELAPLPATADACCYSKYTSEHLSELGVLIAEEGRQVAVVPKPHAYREGHAMTGLFIVRKRAFVEFHHGQSNRGDGEDDLVGYLSACSRRGALAMREVKVDWLDAGSSVEALWLAGRMARDEARRDSTGFRGSQSAPTVARGRSELLASLRRPDDISLRFNPFGLGGRLSAEDAAHFQQASIGQAMLQESVPEGVRSNFERARKLHQYGVLEYEFFTAAADYALLVLEGALRSRFLSFYNSEIPVARGEHAEILKVKTFDDVRKAGGRFKLRDANGDLHKLPIGTQALLNWARREHLLVGTRTRIVDHALAELRNHAAHPVSYTLQMPPHSSGTLNDIAEVINKLWGYDTPGGRLFPSPASRTPRVVGVSPDLNASVELRLDQIHDVDQDQRGWNFAVFLAVAAEDLQGFAAGGLSFAYQTGFQTTAFPCDELWRGSWSELADAVAGGRFDSCEDTVQHLERTFLIRSAGGEVDHARSPEDVLAERSLPHGGDWYAVVADFPFEARTHVRDHEPCEGECPESSCFVRVLGEFSSAADVLAFVRSSA